MRETVHPQSYYNRIRGSNYPPLPTYPFPSTIHLKRDGTAGAWLMSFVARPHNREKAARVLEDLAAHAFYLSAGHEHPDFPRRNKRAVDDLDVPLSRLMADFRKGLAAGRRFNSAALHKLGLSHTLPTPIRRFAKPISQTLDEFGLEDRRVARELHWQRYLPYIHLAAAMYEVSLTRDWPLSADNQAEGRALDTIVFQSDKWIDDAVSLAEEKRSLGWLCNVGNPRKMVRIVID